MEQKQYPKLTLTALEDRVTVDIKWPPGSNIEIFSKAIWLLCNNQLNEPIRAATADYAVSIGEQDKVEMINSILRSKPKNIDSAPLVSPSKFLSHYIKQYEHNTSINGQ